MKQMPIWISRCDYEKLEFVVHKLHGGAAYCGVLRLSECARHLEGILKSKDFEKVDGSYQEVLKQLKLLKSEYAKL